MAIWNNSTSDVEKDVKNDYSIQREPSPLTGEGHISQPEDGEHHSLKRGLQSRQVTMIAIGGAIGTGLIIGTGAALARAGCVAIIIAYNQSGVLLTMVMQPSFYPHRLHFRRTACVPRHGCSWRDGRMAPFCRWIQCLRN